MALTRKFLSALGIEAEKIDEIITAHSDTVEALKEERDEYKSKADKVDAVTEELETAKTELQELKDSQNTSETEWEEKYNAIKSEFESYKQDAEEKATKQSKIDAYKKLLRDANVSDKRIDSIIKVSEKAIEDLEFDADGTVKDADKLTESIKTEWADFVVTERREGAKTPTPPANATGGPKTESRAAKLAEQYHNSIYGETKKED